MVCTLQTSPSNSCFTVLQEQNNFFWVGQHCSSKIGTIGIHAANASKQWILKILGAPPKRVEKIGCFLLQYYFNFAIFLFLRETYNYEMKLMIHCFFGMKSRQQTHISQHFGKLRVQTHASNPSQFVGLNLTHIFIPGHLVSGDRLRPKFHNS